MNAIIITDTKQLIVHLIISITILVGSSILAVFSKKISKKLNPIYVLLAGVFFAVLSVILFIDNKPNIHGKYTTLFLSIFHSIQIMLLGYDYEWLSTILNIKSDYVAFTFIYMSFLFFLGPLYTFGFVLSFFENINAHFKYILSLKQDMFILSDLSEKSLVLAKSIRKKFPKSVIIFTNVYEDTNENLYDYIEQAKEIKAILFKKDITDIGLRFHKKKSRSSFFVINENESTNLECSLKLIEKFKTRANTELYVFSTSKEGELLLDAVDNGIMKVRRINENRSYAYHTILDKPITEHYTQVDNKKIISTLVVGFGGYGSELTKALLWCGQLPEFELEINVLDANPETESKFTSQCPEIMLLNGNKTFGESMYTINFFNGINVETDEYNKIISKISNTSVIYISLGNDELNIETAINTRIFFERIGVYPIIRAAIYSDVKATTLKNNILANHEPKSYDIEIVGNVSDLYDYDTIINEELEKLALECHLRWSPTPEEREKATKQFNNYEYYRNSSIATAIHEKYRSASNLPEDIATVAEHMRWNAYMRTEGFIFSGSKEKSSRNDRAKMHNNLHRFGLLSDEDIDKDRRIAKPR